MENAISLILTILGAVCIVAGIIGYRTSHGVRNKLVSAGAIVVGIAMLVILITTLLS